MRSATSPSKRTVPLTTARRLSHSKDENKAEHDVSRPSSTGPLHSHYYDQSKSPLPSQANGFDEGNHFNNNTNHVIRNDGAVSSDMHYSSTTRHRRRVAASSNNTPYQQYGMNTNTTTPQQQLQQQPTNNLNVGQRARNTTHSHSSTTTIDPPTFAELYFVLHALLKGYLQQFIICIRRVAPKFFSYLWKILLIIIIATILLQSFLFYRMFKDAMDLCTPPNDMSVDTSSNSSNEPPLVEYYVHGHGNGHYARSVAIVEQLLEHGIDVRMFIGRATMWRAVNAAHSKSANQQYHGSVAGKGETNSISSNDFPTDATTNIKRKGRKGIVTVISVSALLPSMSKMDNVSLIIDRVASDCEVSKTSKRYPMLVITDGDMPGMFRAKFGSIPSVGIAHGQTFVVGKPPLWVRKNSRLKKAWSKQHSLNIWSSRFTNWQIGTNFVDLPTNGDNAVIARSPMRPEVLAMAKERFKRKKFGMEWITLAQKQNESDVKEVHRSNTDVLLIGENVEHRAPIGVTNSFLTDHQKYVISELLLEADVASSLARIKSTLHDKHLTTMTSLMPKESQLSPLERRKLVICYFRDKNGDLMTNALLRSGFDVLLFERGYHKGLSDTAGAKKFGQEWVVHREHEKHSEASSEEETLDSYWKKITQKYERKLLEDVDIGSIEATGQSSSSGARSNASYDLSTSNSSSEEEHIPTKHSSNEVKRPNKDDDGDDDTDRKGHKDAIQKISDLLNADNLEPPRIIRVTDMSLFVPLLSIADGVASSAGSQLLSECIYANVPILALYRENDDEQMLNIQLSRHRFGNDNTNTETIENVVHGISLEKFTDAFSVAFNSDLGNTHHTSRDISDKILTGDEELKFIKTPEMKRTYDEFNAYVESLRKSEVSWSYYHDLFYGIFAKKVEESEDNAPTDDDDDEYSSHHDPFQGMPEASGVILEIIKEVLQDQQI